MTYIAFDHHKKWTQAAAIDDQGKIIGYALNFVNFGVELRGRTFTFDIHGNPPRFR